MEEKINKENLQLVMRFLKIANLWLTWLEYLNSADYAIHERKRHHWTDWDEVGRVFGHCAFTTFLNCKGIFLQNRYSNVANTFRVYVKMVKNGCYEDAFRYAKTAFIKKENRLY